MTTPFADMPSSVIVAVMAKIARYVQHLAEHCPEWQWGAIDNAIQVAEESARSASGAPKH